MWYRKALDLKELNEQFPEERDQAIEAHEDALTEEQVQNILDKMNSGESWESDSGAIKVEGSPRIEPPFTDEEVDGRFDNETTDAYDVYESLRNFVDGDAYDSGKKERVILSGIINTFKNLANVTLSRYVDSGVSQEFTRKMDSLSPLLEKIVKSAEEKVKLIEKSFNDTELSRKFSTEGFPRLTENEVELANRITLEITKAINEFYYYIRNDDAKQEWLQQMSKKGVAANFLRPQDKTRYKNTMNRTWGLG